MEIADLHKIKGNAIISSKTKQISVVLFLLCFAVNNYITAQPINHKKLIERAQFELYNGNYAKAFEIAVEGIERAKKSKSDQLILIGLDIIAASQILSGDYTEAETALNQSLQIVSENQENSYQKAKIYLRFADLWRSQHKADKSLEFAKKALVTAPGNKQILGEYYLNLGRILFSAGYDYSAIIWLEKAEQLLIGEKPSEAKLDTYRFLYLAWSAKLNYQKALNFAEKRAAISDNSPFKYKYRQTLFELGDLLSITDQKQRAFAVLKKGLELSLLQDNTYQGRNFLSVLALNSLYNSDLKAAEKYFDHLERLGGDKEFSFDILLGRAVIAGLEGRSELSEKLFSDLEKLEHSSDFTIPQWKMIIAEKNKNWEQLIQINDLVLDLTLKNNFRDDLPNLYFNYARSYFYLGQTQKALENLEKVVSLIEQIRRTENTNLSLGLMETHHNAYRLLAQIKSDNPQESFELADFLKARFLEDKINNSAHKTKTNLSPAIRQKLEELSSRFIADQSIASEIEKTEKSVTSQIPDLNLTRPDLTELNNIPELNNTAIISYFFTLDRKLQAFVWEKDKSLKTVNIPITEDEVEIYSKTTHRKIKDFIFFKKDGKEIYDKLLIPLDISAKHLIIIPDKSLWKIPFQALSPDGEKYLIEENLISYAPSVFILLQQLKNPKPDRLTLQAFANSSFDNRILQYVNAEAASVSEIYNSKPLINATVADFERFSDKADILHFSMHAQVDNEQPLESFLGFRKYGKEDGRLTVEEILDMKLKRESLVFLASCDTNNVFNGEGLVSLAWGMMASGATSVIFAQWEANDKSTAIFTKTFYGNYKQGISAADALQKAAVELIRNKTGGMHEPYYWADFMLNGDFR